MFSPMAPLLYLLTFLIDGSKDLKQNAAEIQTFSLEHKPNNQIFITFKYITENRNVISLQLDKA